MENNNIIIYNTRICEQCGALFGIKQHWQHNCIKCGTTNTLSLDEFIERKQNVSGNNS